MTTERVLGVRDPGNPVIRVNVLHVRILQTN